MCIRDSHKDLQAERGEPVEDTARTLSRYVQGILMRTFSQEDLETFAKYATCLLYTSPS